VTITAGILLVLGGAGAGFVNTVAGAGSALTLPLLMLAGLDAGEANGTNRLMVLTQSASATLSFHARRVRPWSAATRTIPPVLAGAGLGALIAVNLPADALERIFGGVFLLLAVLMVARPSWLIPAERGGGPRPPGLGGHLSLFAVGLYGGALQAGVGIPLLLVLVRAVRVDLVAGNALKVLLVTVYIGLTLVIFAFGGQLRWAPGLLLAAGALVGSLLGASAAVKGGPRFIRWVIVAALSAAAVRWLIVPLISR